MKPRLLLVCGPWGSGTSVVTAVVGHLGAVALGPLFPTTDSRTPNSYEMAAFRDIVLSLASESTVALRPAAQKEALPRLKEFRDSILAGAYGAYGTAGGPPIVLKTPLSALLIRPICQVFDAKLIFVIRPFADIENSRRRRQWPPQYGVAGASRIYTEMFATYIEHVAPALMLHYLDFTRDPEPAIKAIADFGGLTPDAAQIEAARREIRRSR